MTERLTASARRFIADTLNPGGRALDATAGTGMDTVFLAAGVGASGRVHAFDIQPDALARTARRLATAGLADRVHLHAASHAHLGEYVGGDRFCAVMFNLGWLPGGSEAVITRPETTLAALAAAAARLEAGGRLSILAYRGHAGGPEEQAAVERWVGAGGHGLDRRERIASGSRSRPGPVWYGLARP